MMAFLTCHTTALILLSLLVQGLLPLEQRARTRGVGNHGHFDRDLEARASNDVATDGSSGHNVFERPVIRSESDFVSYCERWFFSSQKDLSNAFVSQGDLVNFLVQTCLAFDEEDLPEFDCPAPAFTSIAVDVQLVFVKHLCNVKVGEDMVECLKSIVETGREFGHGVDLTKSPFAEELCCGLLPFLRLVGLEQSSGKLSRGGRGVKSSRLLYFSLQIAPTAPVQFQAPTCQVGLHLLQSGGRIKLRRLPPLPRQNLNPVPHPR
jgi:hypothetical protein